MTLLDRITAAQPEDQRELIEEGAYLLRPVWLAVATDWNDPGCEQFAAMLDAGAYLDAVLLMMPEGDTFWRVGHDGEGADPSLFRADILRPLDVGKCVGTATTPALALLAAILKAGGHDA